MGASVEAQLIPVTFTLDTAAYLAGDLLADTQEIPNAVLAKGRSAELRSIIILDEDDQGIALDVLLFNFANVVTSLGAENAAFAATDAQMRSCVYSGRVAAGDYTDLGGARIGRLSNIGHMVEADATTRSLYVALVTQGAPTHTVNGLRAFFGFKWY